jgi:hypothetical protein
VCSQIDQSRFIVYKKNSFFATGNRFIRIRFSGLGKDDPGQIDIEDSPFVQFTVNIRIRSDWNKRAFFLDVLKIL